MKQIRRRPETIAVFGGSGATGLEFIRQALRTGFRVRALIRPQSDLGSLEHSVEITRGSLEVSHDVDRALQDSCAACCLFGPRPPYTDIFCAAATEVILEGMKSEGVRRILCQTGAMIGDYPANRTVPFRLVTRAVRRRNQATMLDRDEQERTAKDSGLDWTLIKPPRLTNGHRSGRFTAHADLRVGLLSKVSRADVAAFILDEILNPHHIGRAVFVRG
jgi:putative NADH-flavin reductase